MLLAIAFCCSFVAPDPGLHKSALQAFDSTVGMLSRASVEQSAESVDYEPDAEGTPQHRSVRAAPGAGFRGGVGLPVGPPPPWWLGPTGAQR